MSNKSKEETDCYINFNTADGQILKYTLEGYVENVYVSTRDARDALIDMYDICIETNQYSDAAKQILILAAFINIDRKSVVKGKSVSVSVDLGGRRIIKKNTQKNRRQ